MSRVHTGEEDMMIEQSINGVRFAWTGEVFHNPTRGLIYLAKLMAEYNADFVREKLANVTLALPDGKHGTVKAIEAFAVSIQHAGMTIGLNVDLRNGNGDKKP